ncbi:MAG TPA: hypothetical protein VGT02_04270 [Methylomirabilota bacterium]|jgi:hypothetical protein|nr:hypothetical protein [Methylomirabilota bacterium]
MERLQWWLLLLSAVMFSMSGCATLGDDWQIWSGHPVHFASGDHLAFSVKSHETNASITETDTNSAAREEWWGRLVPEEISPAAVVAAVDLLDVTGRWRGQWTASGVWGDPRGSEAEVVFVQYGAGGTGRMKLFDTVAAIGVPDIARYFGSLGTPVSYRVTRGEVIARYENGPALQLRFTRVGDRLYGTVESSPSFLLVLEKQ